MNRRTRKNRINWEERLGQGMKIRIATLEDARELLEIYRPYVEQTAITFEYEVPSLEEFRSRIENTLKRYPYIVAEQEGELLGYAYTGPFKSRAAYDWAVETTVYVKGNCRKKGVGKTLYAVLEELTKRQNILNMNACIAYPEGEDEHLTKDSVHFHHHLGYEEVGQFHKCGYKFDTWYNMIWMEKLIGEHAADPEPVIPFPQIRLKEIF